MVKYKNRQGVLDWMKKMNLNKFHQQKRNGGGCRGK